VYIYKRCAVTLTGLFFVLLCIVFVGLFFVLLYIVFATVAIDFE